MKRAENLVVCLIALGVGWLGSASRDALFPPLAAKENDEARVFDTLVVKRLIVSESDHRVSVMLEPGMLAIPAPGTDLSSNMDENGVIKSTAMIMWLGDGTCALGFWDSNGKLRAQLGTSAGDSALFELSDVKGKARVLATVDPSLPGGKGVNLMMTPENGSPPWEVP